MGEGSSHAQATMMQEESAPSGATSHSFTTPAVGSLFRPAGKAVPNLKGKGRGARAHEAAGLVEETGPRAKRRPRCASN